MLPQMQKISKGIESNLILPGISMLGMYIIVFISMALEAQNVIRHPEYFLIVLAPLAILYAILFSGSVMFSRLAKFSYEDMIAFSYGVAGKNIAIALWSWPRSSSAP